MAGLAEGQESSSDRCSSPSLSVSVLDSQEALNESKATTEEDEGGWSYKFVDVVDKEFECIICLLPLKNPFMTRCGHGMCKTCLDKLLEKNPFCPEDRTPLKGEDVFPDMRYHRKIMGFRVKCPYAEMEPYSCQWIGELNDLVKKHLDSCEREEVMCIRDNCNENLTRGTFTQHVDTLCPWREVPCYFCQRKIFICQHQTHQDTDCAEFTIPCPNICTEQMPRKFVGYHLQNHCPRRLVSCPFVEVGCNEQVLARDLNKHLNDNVGKHLSAAYFDQSKKLKTLTLAKQEQRKQIDVLTLAIQKQEKQNGILSKELDESKQEMEKLKNDSDRKSKELAVVKEEQERQNNISSKELNQSKREMETLRKDCDKKCRELISAKQEQEKQNKISTKELNHLKQEMEICKQDYDKQFKELSTAKQQQEMQNEVLAKELNRSEKEMEILKQDYDKQFKELSTAKQEQEKQNEVLAKELNQSKQEMEIFKQDYDKKVKELTMAQQEQEKQIEVLTEELNQSKRQLEMCEQDYDKKFKELSTVKQEQEKRNEGLTKELNQSKRQMEMFEQDYDKKFKELSMVKQEQGKRNEVLTNELDQSKQEMEMFKQDYEKKVTELTLAKQEQERQSEITSEELNQLKQNIETLTENYDKKFKELIVARQEQEKQNESKELNESRQEIEILRENIKQLTEVREKQEKIIKQFDQRLNHLTIFTFPHELSDVSDLLSFVSKEEDQQVFYNMVNFLRERPISDCQVMKNSWSYRQGDKIIFVWFLKDFKLHQQEQKVDKLMTADSPYFRTGEKGYLIRVRFDPYGYSESRGSHLSCFLSNDQTVAYEDEIKFPHEQKVTITVINLVDRKNNASARKTFKVYKNCLDTTISSYVHRILSLTDAEKFVVNDTIVLKISLRGYNA